MTQPIYFDGEPQNLEAAALDALEWLKLVHEYIRQVRGQSRSDDRLREDRDRIQRTIEAIETYVTDHKPVYKRTGEPTPQAWAEVVDIIEVDRQ